MKVYESTRGPYIHLTNKGLFSKARFKAGDSFKVEAEPGRIVLSKSDTTKPGMEPATSLARP